MDTDIKEYIRNMSIFNPIEYKKLMKGFKNEDELVKEASRLAEIAINSLKGKQQ
jgi:hypothetical protein